MQEVQAATGEHWLWDGDLLLLLSFLLLLLILQVFSDHMLTMAWSKTEGWEMPKIVPHGPLR